MIASEQKFDIPFLSASINSEIARKHYRRNDV